MNFKKKYLKILNLGEQKPSLPFLRALIQAQLKNFPYENLSKLIDADNKKIGLITFEEYLQRQQEFGFGGTCFVQNIYFRDLLVSLGFTVELLTSSVDGAPDRHLSCRIHLDTKTYIVDFGLMDAFSGPFEEGGSAIEEIWGGRRFLFIPKGFRKFRMEIYKESKLQRYFDSSNVFSSLETLQPVILESFEPSALFMKNLVIGKRSGNPCFNLWNNESIVTFNGITEKRKILDLKVLKKFVAEDMGLEKYPIEKAYEILLKRGHGFFDF